MLEGEVIGISIKDFFTKPMLKIAILPLVFTMIIMLILFYTAAGYGFESFQLFMQQAEAGQEVIVDPEAPFYIAWGMAIITFLFKYSITSWLVGFLVYTVGTIFVLMFSVFLTIIVIGFLTPMILKILHKRHYSHIEIKGFGTLLSPLWVALKTVLIMIILFIVFIPLYFIPIINIFAVNLPFYYFFHKLLTFDVASTILTEKEYKVIHATKASKFRYKTLFLYFLSLIPSMMLFSAVFFIIYLGHSYFIELSKLRGIELKVDDIKEEPKLIEKD